MHRCKQIWIMLASKGFDCTAIQQRGVCFEPNTLVNHAAYVMNLLYQTAGRNPLTCDFLQTAMVSTINPTPRRTCIA